MKKLLIPVLAAGGVASLGAAVFDFESGDLQGWRVTDGAFARPVTDRAWEHNAKTKPYTKGGTWFLSTLENARNNPDDGQTGVVESPDVKLAGPKITFRIGGGRNAAFTLVDRASGRDLATAGGANGETMRVETWNVPEAVGRVVFFRVTDAVTGSWGHLTLDDVAFDGTVLATDFAARAAARASRLPLAWPGIAGAPRLLLVHAPDAPLFAAELAERLAGRVALFRAPAAQAPQRVRDGNFDLVVFQGGAALRPLVADVRRAQPRAKLLWVLDRPGNTWGLVGTGVPLMGLYGGTAVARAEKLAASAIRVLGLEPVTAAERAAARAAIDELAAKYPSYPAARFRAALAALEQQGTVAHRAFDPLLREALVRENPLVNAHEIVYTTHAMWAPDHHNTATIFQCGEVNGGSYRTQGALRAFDPKTGKTRDILSEEKGRTIRDPEVDYDGRRLVVSIRNGARDDYHIYTLNADGSDLKQLTRAKGVSDIDPVWLPDGDILFGATREPKYCMCNRHIMANLYRMKPDGANIHQIGKSTLFEGHPTVLPDGRILYDRWEYVDRDFGDAQGLWVCNPDGTRHAIYWGNNTTSPGGVINARALSDASRVIAALGSCHDRPWGALGIIDRTRGVDGREPVVRTWPASYRERIHAGGREDFDSTRNLDVKYADPYPIDDAHFLCTRQTGRGDETAIYYLDLHGNEVLVKEDAPGCFSPIVLRPAKKPVVQARQRSFDAPDAPGRFYVQNVYIGTHMKGVAPGSVKALRIVESPEKRSWLPVRGWFGHGEEAAAMNWHSFENKRILGTVPVEADGSAYFEVPGNTFVYFQALDRDGKMIQSMRSGAYLQPGELYGCVGCHENRTGDVPKTEKKALAMQRAPSKLDGAYNQFGLEKGTPPHLYSFQREVQGVFDRRCTACHDYGRKPAEKLNLSGDLGAYFCTSYVDLWARGYVKCIGGGPAEIQPAYSWGACVSPLTKKLYGHGKLGITDEERQRVITWMDVNAPYWPTYECAFHTNYGGRMPITREEHARLEKLTGVTIACRSGDRQREQLNFTRPELSRILANVRDPAAYAEALAILRTGAERLKKTPRADMPLFVPCEKDREREVRYRKRLAEERRVYDAIRRAEKVYDPAPGL